MVSKARQRAIAAAKRAARRNGRTYYTFYDCDGQWRIGDDDDAETWFLGDQPYDAVGSDGLVEILAATPAGEMRGRHV